MKIYYFSPHATEIKSLSAGVEKFSREYEIKVIGRTFTQLQDTESAEAFIKGALLSDAIFVVLHGGKQSCPIFDQLIKALEEKKKQKQKVPYLHIYPCGGDQDAMETARKYDPDFGKEPWYMLNKYLSYGGSENFYNMFKYLLNLIFKKDLSFEKPIKPPEEGIYHPASNKVFTLEEYLSWKNINFSAPVVGIWFYQSYWLNGDLAYIDALIKEIENRGAEVLAVFHMRYKDRERGNKGADYIVEAFFKRKGKTIIDCLLSPMFFSLTLFAPEYKNLLKELDVPVLQAIPMWITRDNWEKSEQGLSPMDVAFSVAQPEFDGNLITVPVASREEAGIDPITGALVFKQLPIPERVKKLVSLALNWAKLRKKSNKEKRIAIIFHHYPPRNDRIGCSAGLDSFESVKELVKRLSEEGYTVERVYNTGKEIVEALLSGFIYDQKWLIPEKALKAEHWISSNAVKEFLKELPVEVIKKLREDWGEPPGDFLVWGEKLPIPGIKNGNLFISIQPPRGNLENIDKFYHDMKLSPPYYYLAFYRWIRDVFKADAVIHVGKHGTLEWLPGKSIGLSAECYPDIAISDLPNIYPYIINDPGEGTQAKRRSYCCIIDHLTPVFTSAELYEELAELENFLKEYAELKTEDPRKLDTLKDLIWKTVVKAKLDRDLKINKEDAFKNFENFLERLHTYLEELRDTAINRGLHILGNPPSGDDLIEFLAQLTRYPVKEIPSLRECILETWGYDYKELLERKKDPFLFYRAHLKAKEVIKDLAEEDFSLDGLERVILKHFSQKNDRLLKVLEFICKELVPRLEDTRKELDSVINALAGKFVLPGPSGAPTRGQADILPTGRNFYSVDPLQIPSPSAWEVGKKLAQELLEKILKEKGEYPSTVGIILWGTGTMRTRGDDIAEILYLIGVKPVWERTSGRVKGLEVIPVEKLKRPRIDVTVRISGFFRDAFPNLIELLDKAIQMVAELDEPEEINRIKKNVLKDMAYYIKSGMDKKEAFREATFRIFGCPPGTYGAGVSELIESKRWKTQEDLGNIYIKWSSHAYGQGTFGEVKTENFKAQLSRMDVTVKNEDSREYDIMSCTDYYNYYGGLISAVKTVKGEYPLAFVGDSSDPAHVKVRTLEEETRHIMRSRILNPRWLEGMKKHGYKGAGDLSYVMDIVFGWSATAEVVEDWMFEKLAEKYVMDKEMKNWLKKVNPYALQNMIEKLLEAISRGMWKPEEDVKKELQRIYLEIESEIESFTAGEENEKF